MIDPYNSCGLPYKVITNAGNLHDRRTQYFKDWDKARATFEESDTAYIYVKNYASGYYELVSVKAG